MIPVYAKTLEAVLGKIVIATIDGKLTRKNTLKINNELPIFSPHHTLRTIIASRYDYY